MVWHGEDLKAFSFLLRAKSFLGKNSSNVKVKANALWEEEQDRLIYRDCKRKCGLE